jgi:hypothetical protein
MGLLEATAFAGAGEHLHLVQVPESQAAAYGLAEAGTAGAPGAVGAAPRLNSLIGKKRHAGVMLRIG